MSQKALKQLWPIYQHLHYSDTLKNSLSFLGTATKSEGGRDGGAERRSLDSPAKTQSPVLMAAKGHLPLFEGRH